jgi:signal peptidase I
MNETSIPRRPSRRWVAFLLSLLAPGLGQLYAGFPKRAAVAVLIWLAVASLAVFFFVNPAGGALALGFATALLLVALLGVPIDAALVAGSTHPFPEGRWPRLAMCIVVVVGFSEISTRAAEAIRSNVVESFRAPSGGMIPTLHPGDHFFVDKRSYNHRSPARGEVVVFWAARDGHDVVPLDSNASLPREQFIKRVVGVPGDRVRIEGDLVFLNGSALPLEDAGSISESGREFKVFAESSDNGSYTVAHDPNLNWPDFGEVTIGDDRFFLLGDNRDNSRDSRHFGTISRQHIVGRATHIYFSLHPATGELAWSRVGMRVQ